MKIITFFFALALLLQAGYTSGQIVGNKKFDDYYQRKNIQPTDDLKTKKVFYFTGTFPTTLVRMENADDYILTPSISLGSGGLFVFGKSSFSGENARRLEPVFSFGIAADVGVKMMDNKMESTFNGNLMFGFHWVNLMMGYDFLSNNNYIGIALRIDLISFSPNCVYIFSEKDAKKLK